MSTKEKIIDSAIQIFAEKGKFGTTMEEIALKAKVNKAMVYYFFSTKDNLYSQTLDVVINELMEYSLNNLEKILEKDESPERKVFSIVEAYFDSYLRNINHTKILTQAITTESDMLKEKFCCGKKNAIYIKHFEIKNKVIAFFEENIEKKIFKKVDVQQLMISIVGMSIICFLGRTMAKTMFDDKVKSEKEFLKDRVKSVTDLILFGIIADVEEKNV